MSSAILQEDLFADVHESRFQGAKRSNMAIHSNNYVDLLILRNRVFRLLTVRHEQRYPARGRFANARVSCIHVAKRSDMCSVDMKSFDLQMLRNRFFKLGKVHIWLGHTCKVVEFLIVRKSVFRLGNRQIWAVLSCKRVDLLMPRKNCLSCVSFKYLSCRHARGRLTTSQKSRFQAANGEIWAALSCKRVDLLTLRKLVFKLRIIHIFELPSCKGVD